MSTTVPVTANRAGVPAQRFPPAQVRMEALDVFRGVTIAAMMLVNNAGNWDAVYWPLDHAEWNGWTPTDLIFPFFLFIVGVSMVLSFRSRQARGQGRAAILLHSLRRAAIIFAIGLFLNGYPTFHLANWRIPGVLQRIAVVYLIASAITLYSGRRTRIAITAACLLGYWALMKLVPVPGFGAGVLTPVGNLASYIDRQALYNHLYIAHTRDPEGILSTIPAIATCLLGVFTGEWLQSARSIGKKLRGMVIAGVVGLIAGKVWNVWFPINKNIWTSSYVLFTAGFALVILALCIWLVDVRGWKRWGRPFLMVGMNPLGLYAFSGLLAKSSVAFDMPFTDGRQTWKEFIYGHFFAPLARPINASLLYGLAYVFTFLILGWLLYRKRIFIKV